MSLRELSALCPTLNDIHGVQAISANLEAVQLVDYHCLEQGVLFRHVTGLVAYAVQLTAKVKCQHARCHKCDAKNQNRTLPV